MIDAFRNRIGATGRYNEIFVGEQRTGVVLTPVLTHTHVIQPTLAYLMRDEFLLIYCMQLVHQFG
jgi:hypothetical protein